MCVVPSHFSYKKWGARASPIFFVGMMVILVVRARLDNVMDGWFSEWSNGFREASVELTVARVFFSFATSSDLPSTPIGLLGADIRSISRYAMLCRAIQHNDFARVRFSALHPCLSKRKQQNTLSSLYQFSLFRPSFLVEHHPRPPFSNTRGPYTPFRRNITADHKSAMPLFDQLHRDQAHSGFVKRLLKYAPTNDAESFAVLEIGCGCGAEILSFREQVMIATLAGGATEPENHVHPRFVALDRTGSAATLDALAKKSTENFAGKNYSVIETVEHTLPDPLVAPPPTLDDPPSPSGAPLAVTNITTGDTTRSAPPFCANTFDLVFARLSLHYFSEPVLEQRILPDIKRLLTSDKGVFVLTVKTRENRSWSTRCARRLRGQPSKILWSGEKWRALLERVGFRLVGEEERDDVRTDTDWIAAGRPWTFECRVSHSNVHGW